jgi:multidrug efflux system outer membrane protein
VSDALAGRATIDQQLQAQQALLAATTRQSELTDLRYKNGVASNLDELDAQRSLFSAQQALVQTRLLLLQNRINLYKALGGGWA